jgi:magnesium-transporting ATPase (P-type)
VAQLATDEQQERQESQQESRETAREENFRRIFSWVLFIGTTIWAIFAVGFIMYHAAWSPDGWFIQIMQEHFAAIVLVPVAALMAMCIVILLRFSAGPIELKGLGFEFRGAAGQVVFWIFCFLAIVYGFYLLW